ncbi:hypothetical protein BWI93_01435 [Siphonobacter sp. BAB-5385]|uniref:MarR family winged helix-turn-helix transcriptional regulator n=1 Tax=unclassified Siphonobacter TaxID=2635712 RepID=UPI000B9E0367|nr:MULTISPECIES: MarR family winged helix-turn-helix transcriptional regulator [unclassified Siphonobacter]OZI09914.1 hypothetical protein BWI93_01435 [Siphonobacter sp. BAB-5385]PMD92498.1 hypothetical protein BWI97_20645 [Siphonobacter sp. BAB-5405]
MAKVSAVPVVMEWERFTEEHPEGGMREFASWLLTNTNPLQQTQPHPGAEPLMKSGMRLSDAFREGEDFLAWFFMGRLIRYVKFYVKPMMTQHGMSGPDEFLFLSLIHEMDRPTKKEVCVAHAIELTTGMDILRRLIKQGLIEEGADERDKRSKRLTLTEKGHQTIQEISLALSQLEPSTLADLDDTERKHLLQVLQYLNNYHFPYYKP